LNKFLDERNAAPLQIRHRAGLAPTSARRTAFPQKSDRSIAMAQYSPEFLAALRYRYEQTDQPMHALAADFGIGVTTLQNLVRKNGWTPRSRRLRHRPLSMLLPEAAEAPPLPAAQVEPQQAPALSLSEGESDAVPADTVVHTPAADGATAPSTLSPAERLQALVEKEIAAEEATRAALGIRPRSRNEAERCARTIVKLTHALQTIQKLRAADRADADDYDEMPEDIDELRMALARRIEGFVAGRIGRPRMQLNQQLAGLTDDELRELIQVGRERGMQALLQPPPGDADDEVAPSRPSSSAKADDPVTANVSD
jgi:hypothetical protein